MKPLKKQTRKDTDIVFRNDTDESRSLIKPVKTLKELLNKPTQPLKI